MSADEIIKYKKLLDEGIITQEQFLEKKTKLLGITDKQKIDKQKENTVIAAFVLFVIASVFFLVPIMMLL